MEHEDGTQICSVVPIKRLLSTNVDDHPAVESKFSIKKRPIHRFGPSDCSKRLRWLGLSHLRHSAAVQREARCSGWGSIAHDVTRIHQALLLTRIERCHFLQFLAACEREVRRKHHNTPYKSTGVYMRLLGSTPTFREQSTRLAACGISTEGNLRARKPIRLCLHC